MITYTHMQVTVFVQGWTTYGKVVVEKLRSRTFYPKQVCTMVIFEHKLKISLIIKLDTLFPHATASFSS